jgi:hypothetical protein
LVETRRRDGELTEIGLSHYHDISLPGYRQAGRVGLSWLAEIG